MRHTVCEDARERGRSVNRITFMRNMELLERRDRSLAEAVMGQRPYAYHVIPSQDPKVPNLVWAPPGGRPICFYDPRGPLQHAHGLLRALQLKRAHVLVCLGLGLGYPLLHLMGAVGGNSPLRKIVVVERDLECLRRAVEVCDLRGPLASPAIELLVGLPQEELFMRLYQLMLPEMTHIKSLKFVPWPAAVAVDAAYYRDVRRAVADGATTWLSSLGNDPFDSLAAYEHFLSNAEKVLAGPLLGEVKGLFAHRPAVVVAAGPSLAKNVNLLRLVETKAVILAVDASWKVLEAEGLFPHFVTSVERTPGTHRFVEGLDRSHRTVYAMVSFIFPETLARYQGPRLFVNRAYNFFKILGLEEHCLAMGNSTAHMAFQLAAYMGCDPIILIGQDLAFDDRGNTHADGCVHGQNQIYFHEEETFDVPGNVLPLVRTSATWYRFLRQYEQHLASYPGTCINATEGGARIQGARVMSFLEAIQYYCTEDFHPRDAIMARLAQGKGASREEFHRGLERIEGVTKSALECCRQGLLALEGPLQRLREAASRDVRSIPARMLSEMHDAMGVVSGVLDRLMVDPGYAVQLSEYLLQPCGIPFLCEWNVAEERFEDRAWGVAYRLKLAQEFLATTGQLCLSLLKVLAGKDLGSARLEYGGARAGAWAR